MTSVNSCWKRIPSMHCSITVYLMFVKRKDGVVHTWIICFIVEFMEASLFLPLVLESFGEQISNKHKCAHTETLKLAPSQRTTSNRWTHVHTYSQHNPTFHCRFSQVGFWHSGGRMCAFQCMSDSWQTEKKTVPHVTFTFVLILAKLLMICSYAAFQEDNTNAVLPNSRRTDWQELNIFFMFRTH